MNNQQETRWMISFGHPDGGSHQERHFPSYEFWHPNKEASIAEGKRILRELTSRGDERKWYAAGFPDPFEVAAGRHPGESLFIPISRVA